MRNHEFNADPAPAFTTDAEIAIADQLRHQLEARYLAPATSRQTTQRFRLRASPAADDRQRDDDAGDDARESRARPPEALPPVAPRSPGPASRPHGGGRRSRLLSAFDRFSSVVTRRAGSPAAFIAALVAVMAWAAVGPVFHFSDGWQLVINTGTTVVTFLMVFLMQQSQNKDSVALHLKLDELIASSQRASNRMIDIEDLDEQDLMAVAPFYVKLAARARTAGPHREAHSVDDQGMPSRCPSIASRREQARVANGERQNAEPHGAPAGTRRTAR